MENNTKDSEVIETINKEDLDSLSQDIINIIDKNEEINEKISDTPFKVVTDIDALHIKGDKVDSSNIIDAYTCKKRIISYLRNNNDALGIAAQQLGFNLRMFGIKDGEVITIFINPTISLIKPTKYTQNVTEQCLSLPGKTYQVKRCWNIKVKYQDSDLKWKEKSFRDFRAIVIQHEYDHINGILISDKGKEVFPDKHTFEM